MTNLKKSPAPSPFDGNASTGYEQKVALDGDPGNQASTRYGFSGNSLSSPNAAPSMNGKIDSGPTPQPSLGKVPYQAPSPAPKPKPKANPNVKPEVKLAHAPKPKPAPAPKPKPKPEPEYKAKPAYKPRGLKPPSPWSAPRPRPPR